MRALLVVNPKATTTSKRSRDVLVRALRTEVDLTIEYTRRRGHAADLAGRAAAEKYDVLVTLGGDGTVNEAVNGLLGAAPRDAAVTGTPDPAKLPALAVVPGGSTNVFARALGLPRDPIESTGVILEALQSGRTRTVGLGRADERFFTFCAGFGLDAEVVRKVERARLRGKSATPGLYLRSAVSQFFLDTERRTPLITLERSGAPAEEQLATVIVQNATPWTFLGERPVNPCPKASFDLGLDLMAMRALRLPATARAVGHILARQPRPRGKQVFSLHDLAGFTLTSVRPLAFQVDGEYLGERDKITFAAVRDALRVLG